MPSDFFNAINTDYYVDHVMPRNQIKILSEMEVAKPHNVLREVVKNGYFRVRLTVRAGRGGGGGVSPLGPDRKQM